MANADIKTLEFLGKLRNKKSFKKVLTKKKKPGKVVRVAARKRHSKTRSKKKVEKTS
ncbi:hypothetical protein [Gottschalkia acidurici]|uniref:hypothetical protein n=1 Tax=Clostridium acidurici TaxID=1556 RepID=UPI0002DD444F|nr:hypothetical protein [Gottschalkia acidurici]